MYIEMYVCKTHNLQRRVVTHFEAMFTWRGGFSWGIIYDNFKLLRDTHRHKCTQPHTYVRTFVHDTNGSVKRAAKLVKMTKWWMGQ